MFRKDKKTNRKEFKTLVCNRTRGRKRQNTFTWNRVTELGEDRGRIHLHGIVFGQRAAELIKKQWGYGIVYVGK